MRARCGATACSAVACEPGLLAAGPVGVAPSAGQRTLLVLLQTLAPYLAQRVAAAAAASAHGAADASAPEAAPIGSSVNPSLLAAAAERRQGVPALGDAGRPGPDDHGASAPGGPEVPGAERGGSGAAAAGPGAAAALAAAAARAYEAGSRVSAAAGAEGRRAWGAAAAYAPEAVRLHLALFYFFGVYYHWAKRATGAQFPRTLAAHAVSGLQWRLSQLVFCSTVQDSVLPISAAAGALLGGPCTAKQEQQPRPRPDSRLFSWL